jgi:putative sigma-54 modulation protein
MNIKIHGAHLQVTDGLSTYIEKKAARLKKYFGTEHDVDLSVTLSTERTLHKVEMMLTVHGFHCRAEETSEDMYASIDLAVDKLRQIHKYKTKLNERFRKHGMATRIQSHAAEDGVDTLESGARVVRVKRFLMKPMDVEEASMQMELLGHDFFVFTNADTNQVNVLYRRRNGDYGLIETC